MKKAFLILAAASLLGSCKKSYLDEELVATLTNDYYKTAQGVDDLVKASYERVRFKFEYEWAYALFQVGTDEFTEGDVTDFNYYNRYASGLAPVPPVSGDAFLNTLWSDNYTGINRCNTAIANLVTVPYGATITNETVKTQRRAEVRFLRAYYYFMLVQQFGAVPLLTTPTVGVQLEFPRTAVPQVYNQIISDLRFASDSLPATQGNQGRATRAVADHFLAKVYLTRGSAKVQERGQKPTDMDSAVYYAERAINNAGGFVLAANYKDLWEGVYTPAVATSLPLAGDLSRSEAAQRNKEILFAAQFNSSLLYSGRFGNQTHLYFAMRYDNEVGTPRDLFGGRSFRRAQPTDYTLSLFDRKNDSRFYKSFTMHYLRTASANIPKWTADNAPSPDLVGQEKFALGDTAVLVVVNDENTTITRQDVEKSRYAFYPRFYKDGAAVVRGFKAGVWPTLVKHLDPFRTGIATQQGTKDGIVARLGETYLIAAEAHGRLGNYSKALEYVNRLRERAAYKAGEEKPQAFWQFEGGTKGDVAATYGNLIATEEKFETNDPAEMYPASATTKAERFIHFILNERSRELAGELYRWEDLARTETLIERVQQFNTLAKPNIQAKHLLRPVPQIQIDLTYKDGRPMSADEKKAYQNTGY